MIIIIIIIIIIIMIIIIMIIIMIIIIIIIIILNISCIRLYLAHVLFSSTGKRFTLSPLCVTYWLPPLPSLAVACCLLGSSLRIHVPALAICAWVVEGLEW